MQYEGATGGARVIGAVPVASVPPSPARTPRSPGPRPGSSCTSA